VVDEKVVFVPVLLFARLYSAKMISSNVSKRSLGRALTPIGGRSVQTKSKFSLPAFECERDNDNKETMNIYQQIDTLSK
jgi:hypothetical protein